MKLVGSMPKALWRVMTRPLPASVDVMILVLLIALGFGIWTGIRLFEGRETELGEAGTNSANLARAIAQHADDNFALADSIVLGLVAQLEEKGNGPDLGRLHDYMALVSARTPLLRGLFIYDERGAWLANSLTNSPADLNSSDRDYFQYHLTHPGPQVYIGAPVRGRSSGEWVLPVSRRYERPDGSFAGVVLATLDMSYFQRFYDRFDIGDDGSILLASDQGTVLVRRPFVEANLGRSILSGHLFQDALPQTPIGTGELVSAVDGSTRIYSWRKLDRYPVIVAAALSKTAVLADWRSRAANDLLNVVLVTGLLVMFGYRISRHIARRAQAERAAAAAGEQYRLLADNSTDMIVKLGMDDVRRYVSPVSRTLLGYDPAEMVGKSANSLIHPDDRARVLDYVRKTAPHEAEPVSTYRVRRKDGTYIWIEVLYRFIRDPLTGKATEYLAIARNVGRRVAAEVKLRAILNSTPGGVAVIDRTGRVVTANPAIEHMFGLPVEELTGQPIERLVPDLFRMQEIQPADLATADAGGRVLQGRRRDGTSFPLEIRLNPVELDGSGELVAAVTDISIRQAATAALSESEARYRLLADNSADMIMRISRTLDWLYISPASRSLLGYEPAELIGKHGFSFIHPDDIEPLRALAARGDRGEIDQATHIYRLRRKDGSYIWVEGNFRMMRPGGDGADYEILGVVRDVTARQAALAGIAASEVRYRLLAENTSDAILRVGLDCRLRYLSPAIRRLTGRDPEFYLVGKLLGEFIHSEDRPAAAAALQAFRDGADVRTLVVRTQHRDGREVWLEATARLVRDPGAAEAGEIVCVVRDITERREAENALRLSEEQFRGAFDTASYGMALVAPNGRFLKVNRALCGMLGYTEADLLTRDFQAITHPDDLAADISSVEDLLSGRIETYQMEKRYLHRSGRVVWSLLSVSLIRYDDGRPVHFVSQIQDITLAKAAMEQAGRLAAIVGTSADAIISQTIDGTIIDWNPAAERLYGWTAEEMIGRLIYVVIPEDHLYEEALALEKVLAGQTVPSFDTVRVARDGRRLDVSLTVSPVFDPAGNVIGAAKIIRDVTDRKQAELKLEAAMHEAEQASRAKSEFLATMSHEIRTPMNGIIGMNGLLLGTELNADQRRYANAVKISADSLLGIINDILDVSKLEAGKVELEEIDFSLAEIIEDAVELLSPRAQMKGLD
ncbi:MAG TPA: PAS domain S-box protein, partial [Aliidongia sp.]|nr:PAS domain S-box protein [Aliidongia sp.]